ncbi:MAG: type I restriction-modification system subunit M N-terminal domain-containing protein, partial [Eubacteriaceae bacterium]
MTTIDDIKNALWKGADTFRGTIDAANYKDFVLSMLFIKYLDDKYDEYEKELEKKYDNPIRLERAKKNLPFILADEHRFRYLYANRNDPK